MIHSNAKFCCKVVLWFAAFFQAAKKSNIFTLSAGFVPQCRDPDLGGQHFMLEAVKPGPLDFVRSDEIDVERSS